MLLARNIQKLPILVLNPAASSDNFNESAKIMLFPASRLRSWNLFSVESLTLDFHLKRHSQCKCQWLRFSEGALQKLPSQKLNILHSDRMNLNMICNIPGRIRKIRLIKICNSKRQCMTDSGYFKHFLD